MDERTKKSFDFASDATKQIISLSVAILGLTATFFKEFLGGASLSLRHLVVYAWIALFLSVVAGVVTLLSLSGLLGSEKVAEPSIYSSGPRIFSFAQMILFLLGLGLMLAFPVRYVPAESSSGDEDSPKYEVRYRSTSSLDCEECRHCRDRGANCSSP